MKPLEQMERWVQISESMHLEDLAANRQRLKHRADGCGCHQCRLQARDARRKWAREFNRLYGNHQDQEEEFVMNWALNNRLISGKK